jgi:purine-binding chemotaxis protein CheW
MTQPFDILREFDAEDGASDDNRQFLTFTVDSEEYGLDIMTVREIRGWTDVTRLPNSPESLRGVMNLRGIIIPIFDLRARFRRVLTETTPKHVVIILALGERNIGLLVDSVSDILTVRHEEIKATPELDAQANTDFIAGLIALEKRMIVLLHVEKLFGPELLQSLPLAEPAA